ncbi:CBS domain-containing protein cbsx3 [Ranunculus cassubicifolius]
MFSIARGLWPCQAITKNATMRQSWYPNPTRFSQWESDAAQALQQRGLENTTVEHVLKTKGERDTSVYWCRTNDTVYDAVKQMTQHNIGSLVVLKPGEQNYIAGIITERDYLRKIIVQGRQSKWTKVGEIMTEENKLITVTSDTNILKAMRLMTENQIRHMPVIDMKIVGMISIVDVVRAVVDQQKEEVKRLNDFIKGVYY